jgi:hypothetical protein
MKDWKCQNCDKHIAYEWQKNIPCWHFCPDCLPVAKQEKRHISDRIRTCIKCENKFCPGCSYLEIYKHARNLSLQVDICKDCFMAYVATRTRRAGSTLIKYPRFVLKAQNGIKTELQQETTDQQAKPLTEEEATVSYIA